MPSSEYSESDRKVKEDDHSPAPSSDAERKDSDQSSLENGTGLDEAKEEESPEDKKDGKIGGRSKAQIATIMLALCLAVFLAAIDATIITTALPTISEAFKSSAGYTWIGSAYLLANAASTPIWAKTSDIFGRKPMLLAANAVFFVGSLIAALAKNIAMLIVARVIQGLGAGGLICLVNVVIGDLFPLRIRGGFYGLVGATWAIASSLGPILGGVLTQKASWRWCFWINLPIDGVAFVLLVFFLNLQTPRTPILAGLKAIDWLGTLLVVGATVMFLLGLQYGGVTAPWDSAEVLCLIIFGIFTFALFLVWQAKGAKYPIMPLAIFNSITNGATLVVVFLHALAFIAGTYYLPLFFQTVRGATPILSGVYLLPTTVFIGVGAVSTGAFVGKTGQYLPAIWFGLVLMVLGFGLFIDFDAKTGWAELILVQIVAAFGNGPLFQAPIVALQAHINPRDLGTATATLGFLRSLGASVGVVLGGVVYTNQLIKNQPQLSAAIGPEQAKAIGGDIGASAMVISTLPQEQKEAVRNVISKSLQPMWILFCCVSAAALVSSVFIKRKALTSEHEETVTGLEAEKANAEARAAEKKNAKK